MVIDMKLFSDERIARLIKIEEAKKAKQREKKK